MKAITIVYLVLLFNVAGAIVNAIGLTSYQMQTYNEGFKEIQENINNQQYFQSSVTPDTSTSIAGFGDFARGLWIFTKAVGWGLIAPSFILQQFGMPLNIALIFAIPVYFAYGLAFSQFISNRGFKGME